MYLGSGTISQTVASHGYAFVRGVATTVETETVARKIGRVLTFGRKAAHTLHPSPTGAPNSYSGLYGLNAFPIHSDMAHWPLPPRYLLLRCIKGDPAVGTLVVDGGDLISKIGAITLARAIVRPRRPLNGKIPLLRLLHKRAGSVSVLRWDEQFIKPASKAGSEGIALVRGALREMVHISIQLAEAGDLLLLDNWRVLHGRSSVSQKSSRIIERVYLESLH